MEDEWKSADMAEAVDMIKDLSENPPLGYPTADIIMDALKARIARGEDYIDGIPYCPNCHMAVGLEAKFCQNCGQKLQEE